MDEQDTETLEPDEAGGVLSDSEEETGSDEESPAEPLEGPEEPAEGEQPPDTPAPQTERELGEQRDKLARSAATFRRRVNDVLGEDAAHLVACPLCEPDIPGFMFPPELMQPWDEVHGRLLEVLREPTAPFYNDATDVTTCEQCQGYGKVRTGSRVPGHETKACSVCVGFGYTPPPGASANGEAAGAGERVPAFVGGEGPLLEDKDVWGSPRVMPDGQLNPNYGKMPQYKDASLP